jgi:cell division GTPase FtsZ
MNEMMNVKVIGTGAAGNKAVIELISSYGFDPKDTVLINSTDRDIPEPYRKDAIIFGKTNERHLGGCGKERTIGSRLFIDDINNDRIDIKSIVDSNTNLVIVAASTEGGTGSSTAPIISRILNEAVRIPVIMVLFFGFNTDARGMQNTIEICQEIGNKYGVIGISNEKFLEDANNNRSRAEHLANKEFCEIVKTIAGHGMIASNQNIDRTDLFKLVATPGYMCIGSANIKNAKNTGMINAAIKNAIDNTKLVDHSGKTAKRIGLIFNIPEDMEDNIDINGSELISKFGTPYEMYTHIQHTESNPYIKWIVAGMNLPIDHVRGIVDTYKETAASINKGKDSFFDIIDDFESGIDGIDMDMLDIVAPSNTKSNSDIDPIRTIMAQFADMH